jgi:hypothetical protein
MIRAAAMLAAGAALLALAACDVNVQSHELVAAPPVPGAAARAALAEHVTTRTITPAEAEAAARSQDPAVLARIVNQYRQRNGLPAVPLSPLLTKVAEAHVRDMAAQAGGGLGVFERTDPKTGLECGPHSWSNGGGGKWTPVCYTGDGRYALAMYAKPREITGGAYAADGYEIAAWDTIAISPAVALEAWQMSPAHDDVILERHGWEGSHWQAMGVAIGGHFAYIWFGKTRDPGSRD